MLSCQETSEWMGDYIDGRVSPGRVAIWMHFMICGPCRRYCEQLKQVSALAKKAQDAQPNPGPSPQLRQELLKAFHASKAQVAPAAKGNDQE